MHATLTAPSARRNRDRAASASGIAGLAGCAVVIMADLTTAAIYERLGLFADTISAMAAGRGAMIMDTALLILVAGIVAIAFGLWRQRRPGWRWPAAIVALLAVAGIIAAIALFNEYGDGDIRDSWTFHYRLVYALGATFTLVPLLTARDLKPVDQRLWLGSYALAAAWFVAGPLMFTVPTGWDGLFERVAAGIMLLWLVGASIFLIRQPGGR
ncbi:MAG: DUF998 domain-containing protein [Roseitalea porphyridii]|jgi:hypothetical protein|uniref:DUF998 domain-containing protein n=1 Tax=Roseitalea porphyridii TaxID=1852022 RepID=UPI0032EC7CA1